MFFSRATAGLLFGLALAQGLPAQHQHPEAETAPPANGQPGHVYTEPPAVPPAVPLDGPGFGPQSQQTYGLDALLSMAAQNNPTLRQAQLQVNGTLAQAMQAGLYPNPIGIYQAEQIGVDDPTGRDTPGEFQGGLIEQRIVTGGKLKLSREKYLQRARVAEFLAVAQQYQVCNDVRIHFYQTLAAGRVWGLEHELLKTAEDNSLTVREMYNLGQATRPQVHRANVDLQQQRLAVMMAENEYRRHFLQLTSLVGIELADGSVEGALELERDLLDFQTEYARIVGSSPEVHAAWAKLREDQITLDRENVEWIPDIVVSGGAGYNFEARETVGAASVRLEIPLFDRNQGTIRQAESDLMRQQNEVRRTQLRLRNMLADEYQRYLTAWQHASQYAEVIVPESREAYESLLRNYKEDRAEWPDVLDAHREYTHLRIEYVQHLERLRTSEVLIDGYLLHGGLEAAPNPNPPGHIDSTPNPR